MKYITIIILSIIFCVENNYNSVGYNSSNLNNNSQYITNTYTLIMNNVLHSNIILSHS